MKHESTALHKVGNTYRLRGYLTGINLLIAGIGFYIGPVIGVVLFDGLDGIIKGWLCIGLLVYVIEITLEVILVKFLHEAGKMEGMAPLVRYSKCLFMRMLLGFPVLVIPLYCYFGSFPFDFYTQYVMRGVIGFIPGIVWGLVSFPITWKELSRLKVLFPASGETPQRQVYGLEGIRRSTIGLKLGFACSFIPVIQLVGFISNPYGFQWAAMLLFIAYIPFLLCGFIAGIQGYFRLGRGFIKMVKNE
jgi:hypothetical protein